MTCNRENFPERKFGWIVGPTQGPWFESVSVQLPENKFPKCLLFVGEHSGRGQEDWNSHLSPADSQFHHNRAKWRQVSRAVTRHFTRLDHEGRLHNAIGIDHCAERRCRCFLDRIAVGKLRTDCGPLLSRNADRSKVLRSTTPNSPVQWRY